MAKPEGHGGRDYPDYLQAALPHENPVEITLAELAIRLGFPNVFERTGNVLYYDTFEYGISDWYPLGSAAVNYPVLASRGLLNSPYSCLLTIAVGPTGYSQIGKDVAYPYLTTFGLEVAFKPESEFGLFMFGFQVYTGTYCHSVWIRYNDVTNVLQYYDEAGDFQDITTYPIGTADIAVWHPIKVVADLVNLHYARLAFDAEDYGLTAYPINTVASVVTPRLEIGISMIQVGAELARIYVDNVILTMNEPL